MLLVKWSFSYPNHSSCTRARSSWRDLQHVTCFFQQQALSASNKVSFTAVDETGSEINSSSYTPGVCTQSGSGKRHLRWHIKQIRVCENKKKTAHSFLQISSVQIWQESPCLCGLGGYCRGAIWTRVGIRHLPQRLGCAVCRRVCSSSGGGTESCGAAAGKSVCGSSKWREQTHPSEKMAVEKARKEDEGGNSLTVPEFGCGVNL